MNSRLTAICLGAAVALGVGAATPAQAAPLPVMTLDTNSLSGALSGAQLYKVHRYRGRRHCERRWSRARGWHSHRRCTYPRRWRGPGRGWYWRDRDGLLVASALGSEVPFLGFTR